MYRHLHLALCVTLAHATFAQQSGDLDSTFAADGITTTDLGPDSDDHGVALALQPDGRMVVAGSAYIGSQSNFAVARYLADGSLDQGFGTGGRVITAEGTFDDVLHAVAIQADGRIVVAGTSWINGTGYEWVVARYTSDGVLDASFSGDGILRVDVGAGSEDRAMAIAIRPDGGIVTVGSARNTTDMDMAVVRCNADGTLDETFSGDGKLMIGFDANEDAAAGVVIQPNGHIVVAGYTDDGVDGDFVLARITSTGSLDNSFGTNGIVFTSFSSGTDWAYALALRPDGRIVAGGVTVSSPFIFMALACYEDDGNLDTSFDGDGMYTLPYPGINVARSLALMPDGRIVIGGTSGTIFLVAMVNADGTMDNTFSGDGVQITSHGQNAYGNAVALQGDARIVLAGTANLGASGNDFVVLRYLTDLSIGVLEFDDVDQAPLIYPNPIGQSATLTYSLRSTERITIRLMDAMGRPVETFLQGTMQAAGEQRVELHMAHLAPGNYTLTVAAASGGSVSVKVMKE